MVFYGLALWSLMGDMGLSVDGAIMGVLLYCHNMVSGMLL
jgi:hypothetical protein